MQNGRSPGLDHHAFVSQANQQIGDYPRSTILPIVDAALRSLIFPACCICRAEVKRARQLLQQELNKRVTERKDAAYRQGQTPEKREDTITWVGEITAGRIYDPVGM
jgi:hypothetical protein